VMMLGHTGSHFSQSLNRAVARPVQANSASQFDAYDCPAILLGGDRGLALETRAFLQSLGFDVLSGAGHMDVDDEPVLVVLSDFLEKPENRRQFDRIRSLWPLAPVVSISDPADAAAQLIPVFS
jgi:hypothetical protein